MRITRICTNIANGDANKNHNPNYMHISKFMNNTNKNSKVKAQSSKLQLKTQKLWEFLIFNF